MGVPPDFYITVFSRDRHPTFPKMKKIVHVKQHWRRNTVVRSHTRVESIRGVSKEDKKKLTRIANDPEIKGIPYPINVRVAPRIFETEEGEVWGISYSGPLINRKWPRASNIVLRKDDPLKEFTLLHEIGHVDDFLRDRGQIKDEEDADTFAYRKARELNIKTPFGYEGHGDLPINHTKRFSKWERKFKAKKLKKRGELIPQEYRWPFQN